MCHDLVNPRVRLSIGGLAALVCLTVVAGVARTQERALPLDRSEIGRDLPRSALADSRRVREALERLYATDAGRLLWSADGHVTPQATDVVTLLERAADKGLRPSDYDAAAHRMAIAELTARAPTATGMRAFDVALSRAVLRLLDHLHTGRVHPGVIGFDIPDSH